MNVEIETAIEITVKVRGTFTPGAAPLPMRGEAVAVECPGWDEGVEDVEVLYVSKGSGTTLHSRNITEFLERETIEALESELIEAARAELERREER